MKPISLKNKQIIKSVLLIVLLLSFYETEAKLSAMSVEEAKKLIANPSSEVAETLSSTPGDYSFYLFDSQIRELPQGNDGQGDFYLADKSTVNYAGPVMRQVLINDLKLHFSRYNRGRFKGDFKGALTRHRGYYEFDPTIHKRRPFYVKAGAEAGGNFPIYEGSTYLGLCPDSECKVNLRQKMAGVDKNTPLPYGKLVGWNTPEIEGVVVDTDHSGSITPDELMRGLIRVLAQNASSTKTSFTVPNADLQPQVIKQSSITPKGLDIAQLAQKLMHSAVSFSQACAYLGISDSDKKKGLYGDNNQLKGPMKLYTALQHHWDGAFGYFGAARNYPEYTDLQIRRGFSMDSYVSSDIVGEDHKLAFVTQTHRSLIGDETDFMISLTAEKNFGLSVNAAKRDLGASLGNEDFTGKIISAFLNGRHLIQEKPEGYLKYAQAFSVIALSQWEKVIAATVVHYINETLGDYEKYGSEDYKFTKLAKHFSEMKGFAFAFQFNPNSQMKAGDFTEMHRLMGDHPVNPATGDVPSYKGNLTKARLLIQDSFGFDSENTVNW